MGNVINVQMDEDFYNEIFQGGGSDSGGEDCFMMEYYLVDEDKLFDSEIGTDFIEHYATLIKVLTVDNPSYSYILTASDGFSYLKMPIPVERHITAIAGIISPLSNTSTGEIYNGKSWLEYVKLYYDDADFSFLTPITKEEFYSLE